MPLLLVTSFLVVFGSSGLRLERADGSGPSTGSGVSGYAVRGSTSFRARHVQKKRVHTHNLEGIVVDVPV